MISLDTECAGLDLRHGADVFFITSCDEQDEVTFWQWDIDPLTRRTIVPLDQVQEVKAFLCNQEIVLHNGKFDITAFSTIDPSFDDIWDWSNIHDTLLAAHLLGSSKKKDLTSLAIDWLGINIEPYERAIQDACNRARALCRTHKALVGWRIAKHGDPMMPSVKKASTSIDEKPWKADMWLPRAVATRLNYPLSHPWYTVLEEYANRDSETTILLWKVLKAEMERRGLWRIYLERRDNLRVCYLIERQGLTARLDRIDSLIDDYQTKMKVCASRCVNIAKRFDYDLKLPKGPTNGSLTEFCFKVLQAPGIVSPKSKTGNPSLNKEAITLYLNTVYDKGSRAHSFFKNFAERKKRTTSVSFLESYRKFGVATEIENLLRLYANLNPTATSTLRMSMTNPNGQQISKDESNCLECGTKDVRGDGCDDCNFTGVEYRSLRWCFAFHPDKEGWSFDAKNVELRIPAYEANETELINFFERGEVPPYYGSEHLLNFSIVYPEIWEAELQIVGPDRVGPHCKSKYKATNYQWCKNGDFAIGYGCQRPKADATFHKVGAYDLLKSRFANKETLNQQQIAYANKHGYVETIPDSTVDPEHGYPLECRRGGKWNSISPTIPLNYHVQGTAMWWMIRAMNRVQAQLDAWARDEGFFAYIVLQVHDELVIEMPRTANPKLDPVNSNLWRAQVIKRLMEQGGCDLVRPVTTPVGISYHTDNWGEEEVLY